MNIQRYTLPVAFAAGLHGALFMGSILTTNGTPVAKPKKVLTIEVPLPPAVEEPVVIEPKDDDASTGGPRPLSDPAPSLPEPADVANESPFVKPEITSPPIKFNGDIGKIPPGGITGVGGDGFGWGTAPRFFNTGDLDNAPRAKVQRPPEYPHALRQQGVSGSVVVQFDVDTEGRVIRAEAVRYTHSEFVEPALRAVRSWRFEAGRKEGRKVSFRMMIPIEFGISDQG